MSARANSSDSDVYRSLLTASSLVLSLPHISEASRKPTIAAIRNRVSYARSVVNTLKHNTVDCIGDSDSPYADLIDSPILLAYVERYIKHTPIQHKFSGKEFCSIPDGYLERVKIAADALSNFHTSPPRTFGDALDVSFKAYSKFLQKDTDNDIEAIKEDVDWAQVTDEIFSYIDVVSNHPFLSKDIRVLESAKKLLGEIVDHEADFIPESAKVCAREDLNNSVFSKVDELVEKKSELTQLFSSNSYAPLDVQGFSEIFNRASAFSNEFEGNNDPTQSVNIGPEFERFATRHLNRMAIEFAKGEAEGLEQLCATLRGNETLANHFVQKYSRAVYRYSRSGSAIAAVSEVARNLTPA